MRPPSPKLSRGAPLLRKKKRGGTVHLEPQRPLGSSEQPASGVSTYWMPLPEAQPPLGSTEHPFSLQMLTIPARRCWRSASKTERLGRETSGGSAAETAGAIKESARRAQMMLAWRMRFQLFMGWFLSRERSSAANMATRAPLSGSMVPRDSSENPEKKRTFPSEQPENRDCLRERAGVEP